jgi:pheromone shutdown-related protein TraB
MSHFSHPDITLVTLGDRTIYLLGTAHISQESVELVKTSIQEIKPDAVLVELDDKRLASLEDENRWKNLDLKQVIRQKQLSALLASLVLGSYQKRLGNELGVKPGTELHTATQVATEYNIPFELIDRPINITLKRIWKKHSLLQKGSLITALFGSLFEKEKISEEDLRNLKKQDTLSAMTDQMGETLPLLKRTLIDERDEYMTEKIRLSSAKTVIAVVGAGHVPGMKRILEKNESVDLVELSVIPTAPLAEKLFWWALPLAFISLIAFYAINHPNQRIELLQLWILCTSVPAFIGAVLALAHPLACFTAALLAPIAAILRAIPGPKLSLLLATIQVWLVPPRVHELENVMDQIHDYKNWWKNRLLRLFLVTTLPSLGLTLGAAYAITKVIAK